MDFDHTSAIFSVTVEGAYLQNFDRSKMQKNTDGPTQLHEFASVNFILVKIREQRVAEVGL